jgi:hypothetical protein
MGRLLRLGHRRPGLRGRLLRGGRWHVRRLLRLRFRGRRRRRSMRLLRWRSLRLRLTRLLFLRLLLLLLLREQQRAVLAGARRERLTERKSRDNRSGEQKLLRPRHLMPRFVRLGL